MIPHSFLLTEACSNNVAEYQALIIGMEIAQEIGIQKIEVRGDSQLVVKQIKGIYEVRKPDLVPYHQKAIEISSLFRKFDIVHVPRAQNAQANALAGLAA